MGPMRAAGTAIIIAIVVAFMQMLLKVNSRPGANNKSRFWQKCQKEDAIFWAEWVAAGTVSVVSFWFAEMSDKHTINPYLFLSVTVIVLASFSVFPDIFGGILYDGHDSSGHAQLKSGPWGRILLVDLMGFILMVVLVFVGGAGNGC